MASPIGHALPFWHACNSFPFLTSYELLLSLYLFLQTHRYRFVFSRLSVDVCFCLSVSLSICQSGCCMQYFPHHNFMATEEPTMLHAWATINMQNCGPKCCIFFFFCVCVCVSSLLLVPLASAIYLVFCSGFAAAVAASEHAK